ncbi:MAG TPA: ABC transporter transmembrane domain-containing protein [Lachnospiraceae bacterium]|nr:ABC transporter transmembrane domain-containing protein [Lachnospiraceae bacterium]
MRGLINLLRSQIGLVFLTICISILAVTASFAWNMRIAELIDLICEGNQPTVDIVLKMCIYIVLVVLTEGAFTFISGYTSEKMSEELRVSFALSIQNKKSTELAEMNAGSQVSKLLNEVNEISEYLTENLFPLLNNFIKCVVTFIWLLKLNATVTCIANLPVLIILIYAFFTSRILGSLALQSQKARQETNRIADTILELFPVMKLYNAENVMLSSYVDVTNKWVAVSSNEEKRRSLLMSLSAILSCIPTHMLVLVGGRMVLLGEMKMGILYLFISMSANVTGFLMNMPGFVGTFRRFCSNFKSMVSM